MKAREQGQRDDDQDDDKRAALDRAIAEDRNYYVLEFSNVGGLVMPVIFGVTYADGTREDIYIPAEIWRRNPEMARKLVVTDKEITDIVLDPYWETADVNIENNFYPRRIIPSRVEAFKAEQPGGLTGRDLMQEIKTELSTEDDEEESEDGDADQ